MRTFGTARGVPSISSTRNGDLKISLHICRGPEKISTKSYKMCQNWNLVIYLFLKIRRDYNSLTINGMCQCIPIVHFTLPFSPGFNDLLLFHLHSRHCECFHLRTISAFPRMNTFHMAISCHGLLLESTFHNHPQFVLSHFQCCFLHYYFGSSLLSLAEDNSYL